MTTSIYDVPVAHIDGSPGSLREYAGKVVLVVNVASACGLTPQYEALERLYAAERQRGLVIAAFPSNDFGAQEPGSNAEIATFCTTTFAVTFPLFEKIVVTGDGKHPLYAMLTEARPRATGHGDDFRKRLEAFGVKPESGTGILWNFEKFLVGRDGVVVARFAPDVTPDDPLVRAAIDEALG